MVTEAEWFWENSWEDTKPNHKYHNLRIKTELGSKHILYTSGDVDDVVGNFIVTAHNEAIKINPDNPQVVVESMVEMYQYIKEYISTFRDNYSTPFIEKGRNILAKMEAIDDRNTNNRRS